MDQNERNDLTARLTVIENLLAYTLAISLRHENPEISAATKQSFLELDPPTLAEGVGLMDAGVLQEIQELNLLHKIRLLKDVGAHERRPWSPAV